MWMLTTRVAYCILYFFFFLFISHIRGQMKDKAINFFPNFFTCEIHATSDPFLPESTYLFKRKSSLCGIVFHECANYRKCLMLHWILLNFWWLESFFFFAYFLPLPNIISTASANTNRSYLTGKERRRRKNEITNLFWQDPSYRMSHILNFNRIYQNWHISRL